jgi:hypothetical protein
VLVSRTLGDEMKKASDDATKMVNFIKQRPVHSRMFKKLCENLDKQHINLLHAEIRWLSKGRVLNRVSINSTISYATLLLYKNY